MSNPARNDTVKLLSGWEGALFNDECLNPHKLSINNIDLRTSDTISSGLLPDTRGLLLLGERAMKEWTIGYGDYTINEQRGCPLNNKWNLPCIASYLPIDCVDMRDHESRLNPLAQIETNEKEDDTEKRKGKTARSNYRFWLLQDVCKLVKGIRSNGLDKRCRPEIKIYPASEEIIQILRQTKDQEIFIDIETNEQLQITCIGIGIADTIYVVPITRFDYTPAYSNLAQILQAIAISFQRNTVVGHNSASFDLLVLAWKYRIAAGPRNYDTMLAWHRCYPEAERSLGHIMSALTWEPYHKDSGIFAPKNPTQEHQLWEYNAKDVYGTMLIYAGIERLAAPIPGLRESIAQSNRLIRPSLINTLQGMRFDPNLRDAMIKENDRLCNQYVRFIKLALGPELYKQIQGRSDSNLPASSKQCRRYFHELMGYKSAGKSKKTGLESLDADALFKLKQKYPENFVMDLVLSYREKAKESGSLKFKEWVL